MLVPFAGIDETEQPLRAARLSSRGLAQVVKEADLDAGVLTAAVGRALASPLPDHHIDLEGAASAAQFLRERLADSISEDCSPTV